MDIYDIIIAGGGLAGLTAGLYAARYGRSALVLVADVPGGPLISVDRIEGLPGFTEGVAGYEFCPGLQEQAAAEGAEFRMGELRGLEPGGDGWIVVTGEERLRAGAVIVATGARPRTLGVPGEERLHGRGVSHCASCDGPLLRGRAAVVVGGGDSALQEALTLASFTERVIVVHRGTAFTAQQSFQRRVLAEAKITVRFGTVVEAVLGEAALTGMQTRELATSATAELEAGGLFVYIGGEPNTAALGDLLTLDPDGRVPTDLWLRTARPGLFAAGDIRRDAPGQALTAAADGATAAIAAHHYLTDRAWPSA